MEEKSKIIMCENKNTGEANDMFHKDERVIMQKAKVYTTTILEIIQNKENYKCPKCDKMCDYIYNPFYIHICPHCGEEMTYSDLKLITNEDKITNLIYNILYAQ